MSAKRELLFYAHKDRLLKFNMLAKEILFKVNTRPVEKLIFKTTDMFIAV